MATLQVFEVKQRGIALLELTLTLPFMLFIIMGLAEGGRVLGSASWMSQVAFQSAIAGADQTNQALGEAAIQSRYDSLLPLYPGHDKMEGGAPAVFKTIDSASRLIEVSVSGRMTVLSSYVAPMSFSVRVVAPQLVNSAETGAPAGNGYTNPSGKNYNCEAASSISVITGNPAAGNRVQCASYNPSSGYYGRICSKPGRCYCGSIDASGNKLFYSC